MVVGCAWCVLVLMCLARANSTPASLFSFKTILLLQDRLDLRDLVEQKVGSGDGAQHQGTGACELASRERG